MLTRHARLQRRSGPAAKKKAIASLPQRRLTAEAMQQRELVSAAADRCRAAAATGNGSRMVDRSLTRPARLLRRSGPAAKKKAIASLRWVA
jgi:hypothetical protein